MRNKRFNSIGVLSVFVALAISGPLWAQGESTIALEEIIVTATKRAESALDVPMSVSAISGDELRALGALDFGGVANSIPNVQFSASTQGQGGIAIRGVSGLSSVALSSPVGIYLDEMPVQGDFDAQPQLLGFDIDRIEVLRGPQGTLYGEGALGGAIRFISNKPDSSGFSGKVETRYGSIEHGGEERAVNGYLNFPLVEDRLALRIVAGWIDDDGWFDSAAIGEDINSYESTNVRAALRWTPSDATTVDLDVISGKLDGARGYGTSEYVSFLNRLEWTDESSEQFGLTIEHDFGWADFTSATGYFHRDLSVMNDMSLQAGDVNFFSNILSPATAENLDWFFINIAGLPGNPGVPVVPTITVGELVMGLPGRAPYTTQSYEQFNQGLVVSSEQEVLSQEFRLASKGGENVDWVVGLFYRDFSRDGENVAVDSPALPAGDPEVYALVNATSFEQLALFGEVTFNATEQLGITVGARAFREERKSSNFTDGVIPRGVPWLLFGSVRDEFDFSDSETYELVTPKVSFDYSFGDNSMVYLTVSEGFKAGGQNVYAPIYQGVSPSFDPEELLNIELGLKTQPTPGLSFTAAVFQMDWKDLQVTVQPEPLFAYVINAGEAESTGVEAELHWQIADQTRLDLAAGYVDAEFSKDVDDPAGPGYMKGDPIPGIPDHNISVTLDQGFRLTDSLDGFGRVTVNRRGDFSTSGGVDIGAYTTVSARVGIETERFYLSIYGNNLTDEEQITDFVYTHPIAGENLFIIGRPRTIGVELSYAF